MPRSCDAWARAPGMANGVARRQDDVHHEAADADRRHADQQSGSRSGYSILSLFFMLPELNVRTRAYVRVRARHIGALRRVRRTSCPNRE